MGSDDPVFFSTLYEPGPSAGILQFLNVSPSGEVIFAIFSRTGSSNAYLSANGGESWTYLGAFNIPYSSVVTDDGLVYFENNAKLYIGSADGASQAAIPYVIEGGIERKIVAGQNGLIYVSMFRGFDWVIYKTSDKGATWTETPITSRFFNGQAAHRTAVLIDEQGYIYSMDRGVLYKSENEGAEWTQVPLTVDYSKVSSITSSYNAFYMTSSYDINGNFFVTGDKGVAVINPKTASAVSYSFEGSGLASHERFSGYFSADTEGNVYGTVNLFGYDYEFDKRAGAIIRFSPGGQTDEFARIAKYTGFQGMNVFATEAGVVSGANGIFSKGVYTYSYQGQELRAGAPEQEIVETQVHSVIPMNSSACFVVLSHPEAGSLNPAYSCLFRAGDEEAVSMDMRINSALVTSGDELVVFYDDSIFVSNDLGNTWEKHAVALPNMFNNLVSASAYHAVEVGDELVVSYVSYFGGVSGIYTEEVLMKSNIGLMNFQPVVTQQNRPYISGANGKVVYSVEPPIDFELVSDKQEEVYRSDDGGVSYSLVDGPMPIAGSRNGYFVAGKDGKILVAASGSSAFVEKEVSGSGGSFVFPQLTYEFDGLDTRGVPVFPPVRFGADGKLYVLHENRVYVSGESF